MSGTLETPGPRRRFFVESIRPGAAVVFSPREAHHAGAVLRLRPGARVTVFDGRNETEAELTTVSPGVVTARVLGPLRASERPGHLVLLQGIARGPKMDLVARMGTEIGLAAIRPVVTARSMSDPGPSRLARWRRIAQEAASQCGRADLPEVAAPAPLAEALLTLGAVDLLVVPWEREARPIGDIIAGAAWGAAAVLVGPEGGLTETEAADARAAGGHTVSLGPLTLRTETAGLVTAAMMLYERTLRPQP